METQLSDPDKATADWPLRIHNEIKTSFLVGGEGIRNYLANG